MHIIRIIIIWRIVLLYYEPYPTCHVIIYCNTFYRVFNIVIYNSVLIELICILIFFVFFTHFHYAYCIILNNEAVSAPVIKILSLSTANKCISLHAPLRIIVIYNICYPDADVDVIYNILLLLHKWNIIIYLQYNCIFLKFLCIGISIYRNNRHGKKYYDVTRYLRIKKAY